MFRSLSLFLLLSGGAWAADQQTLGVFRDGLNQSRQRIHRILSNQEHSRLEADQKARVYLLTASDHLGMASDRLMGAINESVSGRNSRSVEAQFIKACLSATRAQMDVMLARLNALSPPQGQLMPYTQEMLDIRQDIITQADDAGCN